MPSGPVILNNTPWSVFGCWASLNCFDSYMLRSSCQMPYGLSSWLLRLFPASSLCSKPPGSFLPTWTIHNLPLRLPLRYVHTLSVMGTLIIISLLTAYHLFDII